MSYFAHLVVAHLILDYPLQGEFLAHKKRDYLFLLLVHAFMWGLGIGAVLTYFGIYSEWHAYWLVGGHAVMDWIKCRWPRGDRWYNDPLALPLWVDQAFHLFQLVVVLYAPK